MIESDPDTNRINQCPRPSPPLNLSTFTWTPCLLSLPSFIWLMKCNRVESWMLSKPTWRKFSGHIWALLCLPLAVEKGLMKPFPPLYDKARRLSVVFRRPRSRPPMPSPCGAVSPSISSEAGWSSRRPWSLEATPVSCCHSSSWTQRQRTIRHLNHRSLRVM